MQKFSKNYQIRSYECDQKGDLRLVTLLNLLQDMADTHAQELGLGMDFCCQNGLAWFGANYHIKIERLPKIHENITLITWPSTKKKLGVIRDFEVKDQGGKTIIAASSLWILIDFERKKPVLIDSFIRDYHPLEERALETDFARLPLPSEIDKQCCDAVRYDDLDFNRHVNNSVYLLWAAECTGAEFLSEHTPTEIEIAYKKECKSGDQVHVKTQIANSDTLHVIESADRNILAQLRIKWRKI